ncbi:MAG: hypothetical protein IJH90_10245 [Mogibacterium sp.]|nr:hypothetical protein [Mogibacterium sp.]
MRKKWLAALIIYIALIIICIIVVYAVPSVKGLLEKTYVTEYGSIELKDDVSGYIVRDEVVYVAAEDCEVNRLAPEGKLIKAGTQIVELAPVLSEEERAEEEAAAEQEASEEGQTETAEEPEEEEDEGNVSHKYASILENLDGNYLEASKGINRYAGYICYFVDGAEAKLSTAELGNLNRDDLNKLTKLRHVETENGRCSKGEPVYKIVRNRKWYLVFYLDLKAGAKYTAGRTVTMNAGGEDIKVKIADVETGKDVTRVAIECKTFWEGFTDIRTLDATITVASAEGLILRDSSIIEMDGKKGVLVKNKLGEHRFKPVSIMADDGEQCAAYSDIYVDEGGNFVETIKPYDEIVAEPTAEDIQELNNKE